MIGVDSTNSSVLMADDWVKMSTTSCTKPALCGEKVWPAVMSATHMYIHGVTRHWHTHSLIHIYIFDNFLRLWNLTVEHINALVVWWSATPTDFQNGHLQNKTTETKTPLGPEISMRYCCETMKPKQRWTTSLSGWWTRMLAEIPRHRRSSGVAHGFGIQSNSKMSNVPGVAIGKEMPIQSSSQNRNRSHRDDTKLHIEETKTGLMIDQSMLCPIPNVEHHLHLFKVLSYPPSIEPPWAFHPRKVVPSLGYFILPHE